ncbi:type II toxin-antitoxin system RelE/ParE family toxin [uncultured Sphingomonas sp.]|uniref:type II toxin-antitoxin system RelE/ParE family toxin n=1 Tax=uncultured Sphingomonas sp. TaxID=158754 RepID=UPI0025F1A5F1|nr:type II toxin-antitoxin system RelE/ParE family toxin [uncultured Sphingomonas sp.]
MSRRYRIFFTPAPRRDLEALDDRLVATESIEIAERVLAEISQRITGFVEFPERGSIPYDLRTIGRQMTRQIVVRRNRMLYRGIEDAVVVLLIADGHRDMQTLLSLRLLTPPDSRR